MSDVTNRRRFLAATASGAVLALTPASLLADVTTPSPASAARLADAIAAVLDRPNADFHGPVVRCSCTRCQAIRRAGFSCAHCGFEGEPVVEACECRELRAHDLAFCRSYFARLNAGETLREGDPPLWYVRRRHREALAVPDRMCRASGDRETRHRRAPRCGHGMASCPTCGSTADAESPAISAESLIETIRALRETLALHAGRLT